MFLKAKSFLLLATISLLVACGGSSQFQEKVDYAKINGLPIILWSAEPSSPNSAGGVDLEIDFTNTSNQTIKYLRFNVQAYNSVGDPTGGEIRRSSFRNIYGTGPYKPNVTDEIYWEALYYNWSLECVQITKLTIEYMSGAKKSYTGKSLRNLFGPNYRNTCKVK